MKAGKNYGKRLTRGGTNRLFRQPASGRSRLHEDAVVEVLDDGAEVNRFGVVGAVFGDFFLFDDPETEAFENAGTATFLKGDYLAEDGGLTGRGPELRGAG